jgi:hypothetical protein
VAVTATRLVRGRDYPARFAEFHSWFSDKDPTSRSSNSCARDRDELRDRREAGSRGLLFHRLMEQAVATTPKPAKVIIGGLENAG